MNTLNQKILKKMNWKMMPKQKMMKMMIFNANLANIKIKK